MVAWPANHAVGQCPIKVDVPRFRAKFLELYHSRYPRPARDYLLASLEPILPLTGWLRGLYNALARTRPFRAALQAVGIVKTPLLSGVSWHREMAIRSVAVARPQALAALSPDERAQSVVLVQDAFTRWYDSDVVLDVIDVFRAMGFRPWIAPFRPNGKPLQVHGFLGAFERTAARNAAMLRQIAATGVELVGVDPSMTLTYRAEYGVLPEADRPPPVLLLQEWLARHLDAIPKRGVQPGYLLLPHCTERTTAQQSLKLWQAAFTAAGSNLEIVAAGCCGMAGTYGHETEHRATSEDIYRLSWAAPVASAAGPGNLLATGYSCRTQAMLVDAARLPHPARALLACFGSPAMPGHG